MRRKQFIRFKKWYHPWIFPVHQAVWFCLIQLNFLIQFDPCIHLLWNLRDDSIRYKLRVNGRISFQRGFSEAASSQGPAGCLEAAGRWRGPARGHGWLGGVLITTHPRLLWGTAWHAASGARASGVRSSWVMSGKCLKLHASVSHL